MANTYSKLYIQVVFAVKYREALVAADWEDELYKYITGTLQGMGQKMLAINGMPDHLHLFFGMKPDCCISDLVREIKKASSVFVNENGWTNEHFRWQNGFGAFSYRERDLGQICRYIENQKQHHRKKTFKKEYLELLEEFDIEFKKPYLFEFISP